MSYENNNDGNSFFAVFSGGGGGAGSVTSASNVGTGLGVFKAKVGADLQFRTLLEQKGINLAFSGGSGDEIEVSLDTDIIGIQDGTGWYTFYDKLSSAMASAVSGDVITFFSNVTEASNNPITFKDGVSINLNGYSYTYSPADSSMAFNDDDGFGCTFYNGALIRLNSLQTGFGYNSGLLIDNKGSSIYFNNVFLISEDRCVFRNGGTMYGGIVIGGSSSFNFCAYNDLGGLIENAIFSATESVYNYGTLNNCSIFQANNPTAVNSYAYLTNCYIDGYESLLSGGITQNCTFVNTSSTGSEVVNLQSKGYLENCSVSATNLFSTQDTIGIVSDDSFINNCTSVALGGKALVCTSSKISNSTFSIAQSSNVNAVNVVTLGADNYLYQCSLNHFRSSLTDTICYINDINNVIAQCSFFQLNKAEYCIQGLGVGVPHNTYIVNNMFLQANTCIDLATITQYQTLPSDTFGNVQVYP